MCRRLRANSIAACVMTELPRRPTYRDQIEMWSALSRMPGPPHRRACVSPRLATERTRMPRWRETLLGPQFMTGRESANLKRLVVSFSASRAPHLRCAASPRIRWIARSQAAFKFHWSIPTGWKKRLTSFHVDDAMLDCAVNSMGRYFPRARVAHSAHQPSGTSSCRKTDFPAGRVPNLRTVEEPSGTQNSGRQPSSRDGAQTAEDLVRRPQPVHAT